MILIHILKIDFVLFWDRLYHLKLASKGRAQIGTYLQHCLACRSPRNLSARLSPPTPGRCCDQSRLVPSGSWLVPLKIRNKNNTFRSGLIIAGWRAQVCEVLILLNISDFHYEPIFTIAEICWHFYLLYLFMKCNWHMSKSCACSLTDSVMLPFAVTMLNHSTLKCKVSITHQGTQRKLQPASVKESTTRQYKCSYECTSCMY